MSLHGWLDAAEASPSNHTCPVRQSIHSSILPTKPPPPLQQLPRLRQHRLLFPVASGAVNTTNGRTQNSRRCMCVHMTIGADRSRRVGRSHGRVARPCVAGRRCLLHHEASSTRSQVVARRRFLFRSIQTPLTTSVFLRPLFIAGLLRRRRNGIRNRNSALTLRQCTALKDTDAYNICLQLSVFLSPILGE